LSRSGGQQHDLPRIGIWHPHGSVGIRRLVQHSHGGKGRSGLRGPVRGTGMSGFDDALLCFFIGFAMVMLVAR
jgi:hypothetical protein